MTNSPCSSDQFHQLAEEAFAALPAELHRLLLNVAIFTSDIPSRQQLAEVGLSHPYDLLGLYEGGTCEARFGSSGGGMPDLIHLFRLPILRSSSEDGVAIEECLRQVLLHEIGHHFCLSDEDMAPYDDWI